MILLIFTLNNPPGEFMLSILITICSAGLKTLIPKGLSLFPENKIRIPLNHKQAVPEHFKFLVLKDQETRRGGII